MGMFRRNKLSVTTPLDNTPLLDKGDDAIKDSDGNTNEDGNNANSANNKKKLGLVEKAGNILRSMRPGGDDGDVETIGDQLAVEDQFYLEVPIKRSHPTATNTTNATAGKKRESLFSRVSPKSRTTTVDHADTSTVSSLTYYSGSHYRSHSSKYRSRHMSNNMGCCGSSIGSDDRRRKRSSSKYQEPSLFQWLFSCQGQEEDLTYKTEPICYRRSSRRHALFDDALEDDDDNDIVKHNDATSVVEAATTAAHDDSYTINTKTSGWRRFLPKVRSIPRFRSSRRRSGVDGGKTIKATETDFVF